MKQFLQGYGLGVVLPINSVAWTGAVAGSFLVNLLVLVLVAGG